MRSFRGWWTLYKAILYAIMIPITLYCAITKRFPVAALCIVVPLCIILAWGNYSNVKNPPNPK
jgi:hypothetical protein